MDGEQDLDLGLPYSPHTRQEEGRRTEKKVAKKYGARLHPMSGAGRIKDDASNDDLQIECKDANVSFTLKSADLAATYSRAVTRGRDALWVVNFSNGIVAEIYLSRR